MAAAETKNYVEQVLEFLQPFLPLANCHMVDFLSCDLWNSLIPDNIKVEVNDIGVDQAFSNIMSNKIEKKDLSSSNIQQFLQSSRTLSTKGVLKAEDLWDSLENLGGKVYKPDPQLTMFMSPKKAHEVQVLSRVIASLAEINNTGCIIDLGGGKGYLGSTLAYHYRLPVLSIDCAQVNTHGAMKLATNLQKWWNVMQENNSDVNSQEINNLYKQITSFVSPSTNLLELVKEHFWTDNEEITTLQNLCLVGLHACGDLTPSCIHLFCTNPNIKALCIVGCCYNLITEALEESSSSCVGITGFPMSQYLKGKRFKLGRNARMLAAQSMDRITENDKPPPSSLWYRTLLQMLLIERKENTNVQVGRSKSSIKDFSEYLAKALKKLNLPLATPEEILKIQVKYRELRKLHDIFFMMRVSIAPVIETLILLDRLLYLQEQGFKHTHLVQLFDSVISPRCCGIIAFKKL